MNNQEPIVAVSEKPLDLWLIAALFGLLVLGSIEVFSSSAVYALKKHGDSFYFLKRQLVWLTLGAAAMVAAVRYDYRWLRRWTYPLLFLSLILLVLVLFGRPLNGAKRWFIFGPISVQPVELAKLSLICYLAYSLSKKADKVKTFTIGFVPHLMVCAIMMALLLKQPDLGSSIILGATTLTLLFVAGTKISYLALAVLAAAPLAYSMIIGTPWRMQRFMAYFNPEAFKQGVAFQTMQAKYAMASGGTTGTGLGMGRQQLGYMPEGHSDFILSTIGEEFGFVGVCFLLLLFVIVIWRGIMAALNARDAFGSYLAFGISLAFAYQTLINMGVVLGILPAKGLTLPLVSYGGSSLVMSMYLAGLLVNVARRKSAPLRPRQVANSVRASNRKKRAAFVLSSAGQS